MTQYYIQVPDAVSMTRNPICLRIATNLGPGARQIMALYRVTDFLLQKVYEERRNAIRDTSLMYISFGASANDFDFSAVLDDELSAEVPPAGGGNYAVPNVLGEFLPFANEVASDEVLVATITGTSVPSSAGFIFTVGKYYRLVADYYEGYRDASNTLSDGFSNEAEIFVPSQTILSGGKLHFPFRAEHAFDTILTYINGWEIKVYEMPNRTFRALKGGWDFRDFPDRASLLPAGRQLLSTMPDVRSWWLGQKAWLGILPPETAPFSLGATVYYEDGTNATLSALSLGTLNAFEPFLADISDAGRGYSLLNPSKQIAKVLVNIYAPSISFSATVILISSYRNAPFRREFHFTNSVGGCDWLIAYGKGQASEEHTAEEYEKHVPAGYSLHDNPQYSAIRQRPRQAFAVSSGYRSREERDAAKELLQAEKAFIREGDIFTPIVVASGTVQDEPDGDYRYKLSFEYRYAFDKLSSR